MYLIRCVPLVITVLFFNVLEGATRKGCSLKVINNPDEKFMPVMLYNLTTKFTLIVPEDGAIHLESGEGITFACPNQRNVLEPRCSLKVINNPDEKFMPVMLYNLTTKFTLIVPEDGAIHLESGEGITFACPNQRNVLEPTNSNTTYATCIKDSTLMLYRKKLNFENILCKNSVHGDIQRTNEKCGDGRGKIINIGFPITKRFFKTLIRVCYDEDEGNTVYTEHILHGEGIKYASKSSDRPSFSVAGLGVDIAANIAYKRAFQKSTFNRLLGSARVADTYINSKSYLSRGHLSPDADFLFASSQFTSYYYINACPQWQVINGGNWKSLEFTVRKTAEQYQDTFTIITGTYDVLELSDINNNPTEIYLISGNKLPVPKFIWKIMYNEDEQKGIVFVVLNNPFQRGIHQDDILCKENVCNRYGWGSKSWSNISRGYVYCCDYHEFVDIVDTVPYLEVRGVLGAI